MHVYLHQFEATKARRHEEKLMRSGRSLQAKLPDYPANNL
jgi:hypothetical protein